MNAPRVYRRVERDEWIATASEQRFASATIVLTFLLVFVGVLVAGLLALSGASTADLDYEGLDGARASCLRASRRADYTVVYLNLGSPVQRLQLLLDLGSPVQPGEPSLRLFSERMHKSLTMACAPLNPPVAYTQACEDVVMLQVNSSREQSLARVAFLYQNDKVELSLGNTAATLGLDGVLAPVAGATYWLTTSHLCFAPSEPWGDASDDVLLFDEHMNTAVANVRAFGPLRDSRPGARVRGRVQRVLPADAPIRLFPPAAANEPDVWLSLSERFLYEYGSDVLDKRRQVVELGPDCSASSPELAHVARMYGADCGLALRPRQTEPAVPYRRSCHEPRARRLRARGRRRAARRADACARPHRRTGRLHRGAHLGDCAALRAAAHGGPSSSCAARRTLRARATCCSTPSTCCAAGSNLRSRALRCTRSARTRGPRWPWTPPSRWPRSWRACSCSPFRGTH